jgi:hypothetical protein
MHALRHLGGVALQKQKVEEAQVERTRLALASDLPLRLELAG